MIYRLGAHAYNAFLLATDAQVLPDEILADIFKLAYNPLDPRTTVYLLSASRGLREQLTRELRQRLQEEHEAAAAFCLKMGASCKALREATEIS